MRDVLVTRATTLLIVFFLIIFILCRFSITIHQMNFGSCAFQQCQSPRNFRINTEWLLRASLKNLILIKNNFQSVTLHPSPQSVNRNTSENIISPYPSDVSGKHKRQYFYLKIWFGVRAEDPSPLPHGRT